MHAWAAQAACAAYLCFFTFTRVWAAARFHHTLALAVAFALFGEVCYLLLAESVWYTRPVQYLLACICTVVLCLWLLINIESNSANGMGVPKSEYVRVLGDIMNGDATSTMGGGNESSARFASQRARAALLRQRRQRNKQDGFVRMMNAIEQRNVERLRENDKWST